MSMILTQQEYIAQWYLLLTNYVNSTLGIIGGRMSLTGIEVEWKERLEYLKLLLEGKDLSDGGSIEAHGAGKQA